MIAAIKHYLVLIILFSICVERAVVSLSSGCWHAGFKMTPSGIGIQIIFATIYEKAMGEIRDTHV